MTSSQNNAHIHFPGIFNFTAAATMIKYDHIIKYVKIIAVMTSSGHKLLNKQNLSACSVLQIK